MIDKRIERQHIIDAINEIKSGNIPNTRNSTKYDLIFEGRVYPPKYVLSVAGRFATGVVMDSSDFSGGKEANSFLSKLGFEIKEKSDWSERECYFAVWAYDQLDQDSSIVKSHLYQEISEIIGRTSKSVEFKLQNVSAYDPRPRSEKPISEAPNKQKLLGDVTSVRLNYRTDSTVYRVQGQTCFDHIL
jgi:hypothetical protein